MISRAAAVGIALSLPFSPALGDAEEAAEKAVLPEGMSIEVFADGMGKARSLDVSDRGDLAVGTNGDSIFIFEDVNGDATEFGMHSLDGFDNPNGVAWLGEDLYVAETTRVLLLERPVASLRESGSVMSEVVIDGFIDSTHHGRRVINVGPDGLLYVSLGTPCNVCEPPDPELSSTIRAYDTKRHDGTTYARGLRNSVGFDWHPQTGEMWATDNGRDWMGDELPDDELNRVHRVGLHFGFPYCHQGDLPDPEFGGERPCSDFEPDALGLGPHVAALGIHFVTGFPRLPDGSALVALHGSWNRSERIGYSVNLVTFSGDGVAIEGYEPFVSGWLGPGGSVHARPVDVAQLSDGSLLVSDDYNGAVYRVRGEGR